MKLHITRPSRLAYFLAAFAFMAVGAAKQASAADIATTLSSDPQFSDFVTELKIIGLWPAMRNAQGVTIFAPTNDAFNNTRAGWKTQLIDSLDTTSTESAKQFTYEDKLRGAFIRGVHPVTDFAGKAQIVHSLGSTLYWVDGRNGSTLQVQAKAPSTGEMGLEPVASKTAQLSAPISATNGLIYPINAVIR